LLFTHADLKGHLLHNVVAEELNSGKKDFRKNFVSALSNIRKISGENSVGLLVGGSVFGLPLQGAKVL
jgi:hypothetical protein